MRQIFHVLRFNLQTSTNASREQLNVNRPAQTTLAHSNVLAMKDMNLMKMDLHVEVVMSDMWF